MVKVSTSKGVLECCEASFLLALMKPKPNGSSGLNGGRAVNERLEFQSEGSPRVDF